MKEIAGKESSSFKVLLVDDISLNLLLLDKMLKPFEFQIVKASGGREALQEVQKRWHTPDQIDLAIVDLMMPEVDGFQVIESLRKGYEMEGNAVPPQDKTALPLIILSGLSFVEDRKKGMALGANHYLTKPIVMNKLYDIVTQLLTEKVEAEK